MSNPLPLTYYPTPSLQRRSEEILGNQIGSPQLMELAEAMVVTMHANDGIGLAAPQVGQNIRLAVVNTKDGELVLINPKITRRSFRREVDSEGCLSLPGVYGLVRRPYAITVSALRADGTQTRFRASGLFARVIQHEVDHLDGVLFIQRTKKITEGKDLLKKYESDRRR